MRRVRFSPAAQSDLSHIWDYTLLNWGEDQAEKYLRKIEKACGEIASEHNLEFRPHTFGQVTEKLALDPTCSSSDWMGKISK
jgi:plasmid stabilization system protein ParE